jgi:hypothetical protein
MTPYLDNQTYDRSRLSHGLETVQSFRLSIWAVAATVSILSSRYLLVELNLHYPLHLHLLQLATAGAIASTDYLQHTASSSVPSSKRTTWPDLFPFAIVATLMATAAVFSVQAVLHSQNLPTLIMLAVSACYSCKRVIPS